MAWGRRDRSVSRWCARCVCYPIAKNAPSVSLNFGFGATGRGGGAGGARETRSLPEIVLPTIDIACILSRINPQANTMVPVDKIDHMPRPYDAIYPRQYIAYRAPSTAALKSSSLLPSSPGVTIDGNLDKPFWNDVEWSEDFVDISTETTPKFRTKVKMRWDDDFLYVGRLFSLK